MKNFEMKNDLYENYIYRKSALISIFVASVIFIFLPLLNKSSIPKKKKLLIHSKIMTIEKLKRKPSKKILIKRQFETKNSKNKELNLTPLKIKVDLETKKPRNFKTPLLECNFKSNLKNDDFIFEIEEVDFKPQVLVQTPPLYPLKAKENNIKGYVILIFTVTDKGMVSDISVKEANPQNVFENAAINAVKKWIFKPALKDNIPVNVRVSIPLKFDN